jgi:hypothetical protein
MKIILSFILSISSYAMCEFPHNPPVLCFKGKVISSTKIEHKTFNCKIKASVKKLIRPPQSYFFTKDLNKVVIKKAEELKKENVEFYSRDNCEKTEIITTLKYNCSDTYPKFKDFSLLDLHQVEGSVLDPWSEKKVKISCR